MESPAALVRQAFQGEGLLSREKYARTVFIAWAAAYGAILLIFHLGATLPADSAAGRILLGLALLTRLVALWVCLLASLKRFREAGLHERAAKGYVVGLALAGLFSGPASWDAQGVLNFVLLTYPRFNMLFIGMFVFPLFVPTAFWKKDKK